MPPTEHTPIQTPPTPTEQGSAWVDESDRSRRLITRVVRVVFFVLIVTIALLPVIDRASADRLNLGAGDYYLIPLAIAIGLFFLGLAIDIFTPNKKIATIVGVFLGIVAGLLSAYALSLVVDLVVQSQIPNQQELRFYQPLLTLIKVMVGITLCYLGVTTVLQTQDDFRLVIPYVEFSKQLRGPKPLVIDTSVLIDGRITELTGTGIIQAPLIIPGFVIGELHALADSGDRLKRARGRRGLEITTKLQQSGTADVTIEDTPVPGKAVDQMLVALAERMKGRVVTTDTGLARVAQIQGIPVLNINDVAVALRPVLIPGQRVELDIVRKGEQPGQGVGYLEDGTMIVVERAEDRIGSRIEAEVTGSLQTSAGRLVFAKQLFLDKAPASPTREEPAPQQEPAPHQQPAQKPSIKTASTKHPSGHQPASNGEQEPSAREPRQQDNTTGTDTAEPADQPRTQPMSPLGPKPGDAGTASRRNPRR